MVDPFFEVNIIRPVSIGFVDASHVNRLNKQRSTTGLVFTFYDRAVVLYKSQT